MATQLQARPQSGGLTLHKKSNKATISGGIKFDPVELDAALANDRRNCRNGQSVVSIKDKEAAIGLLSKLCRTMKDLDIFDEFDASLSQMIRRVKALT